jgi:hypothetical protein
MRFSTFSHQTAPRLQIFENSADDEAFVCEFEETSTIVQKPVICHGG